MPEPVLDRERALHEAAHAVVAIRLGLPLASTDIESRPITDISGHGIPDDVVVTQGGLTTLTEGTIDALLAALPGSTAREGLEAVGVMIAAGVEAEIRGGVTAHDVRCRSDVYDLVVLARVLGIGNSTGDPPVVAWMHALNVRAWGFLRQDGKAAWHRVAAALIQRRSLSGVEVEELVSKRP